MAVSYYLAPSLAVLRSEVNRRWPNRSKASDGWIGDAAHSARASDHNPNSRGSVNALDITASGVDLDVLIEALKADSRVYYIISNRVIYSRTYGFSPRYYSGANPHTLHLHVSIHQTRTAEQNTAAWGVYGSSPGLPGSGVDDSKPTPTAPVDTRTDLERLVNSMDVKDLEALVGRVIDSKLDAIGHRVYVKAAEVARDREKRDSDLTYLKTVEAIRDSRGADVAAVVQAVEGKLGQGADAAAVAAAVRAELGNALTKG